MLCVMYRRLLVVVIGFVVGVDCCLLVVVCSLCVVVCLLFCVSMCMCSLCEALYLLLSVCVVRGCALFVVC